MHATKRNIIEFQGVCIRSSGLTLLTSYAYRKWCMTNNFESGPTKDHCRSDFYADNIDVISPHPHSLPHMLNRYKLAELKKKRRYVTIKI
jgi:hypothetical protein